MKAVAEERVNQYDVVAGTQAKAARKKTLDRMLPTDMRLTTWDETTIGVRVA